MRSLHALTKLELSGGVLFGPPHQFYRECPSALKELYLYEMTVASSAFELLSNQLPYVTKISLGACKLEWIDDGEEIELEQNTMKTLQYASNLRL